VPESRRVVAVREYYSNEVVQAQGPGTAMLSAGLPRPFPPSFCSPVYSLLLPRRFVCVRYALAVWFAHLPLPFSAVSSRLPGGNCRR